MLAAEQEELQKLAGQMERLKCYAMGKNNPHLKQSSTNISSADLEFSSNRLETFTTLWLEFCTVETYVWLLLCPPL